MQSEIDIIQLSFALLLIFGGLVFLNLSQRIAQKVSQIEVIYPDDKEYQAKVSIRNRYVESLIMQWRFLVFLELIITGIGGFLAIGYMGILILWAIIILSHYQNRSKIPTSNYDPLASLINRIVMVDVHGNTSFHNAKNSILDFIQTKKLSETEIVQLLAYLIESKLITDDIAFDIQRNFSFTA
jgi:hypothetical protein